MEINLVIKGKPISKDNEKCFNRFGHPFKSNKYRAFENNVKLQASAQLIGHKLLERDLFVAIEFYFPDKRRCDLFNAPKSICDALTGIVWKDDKQIIKGVLAIKYDKENPRTEIGIFEA